MDPRGKWKMEELQGTRERTHSSPGWGVSELESVPGPATEKVIVWAFEGGERHPERDR